VPVAERGSDANWTEVGDGPDRRDSTVGEIDMEEGVEPTQEKKAPSEGARQARPGRRRTSVPEGES
jgi:hypothetical protein